MAYEIKNAKAVYTGGGIYIYYGQLIDGNYFRTWDDSESISICNSDTSVDEADYSDFYEEHEVETLTDKEFVRFWNKMLRWIIENDPNGNYLAVDLERRFKKDAVTIEFTGDELKILLNGLLALIQNNNNAAVLVYDEKTIEAIYEASNKYKELNSKICGYMEE